MKRFLKFTHELGGAGLLGALGVQAVLSFHAEGLDTIAFATVRHAMLLVSQWVLVPSLLVVVLSGLAAIAAHPPFHNAGWVWIKALTTILMLEGTMLAVHGPVELAAEVSAAIAAGDASDAALLEPILRHERGGFAAIGFVSIANVLLAVWRPRFRRRSAQA